MRYPGELPETTLAHDGELVREDCCRKTVQLCKVGVEQFWVRAKTDKNEYIPKVFRGYFMSV